MVTKENIKPLWEPGVMYKSEKDWAWIGPRPKIKSGSTNKVSKPDLSNAIKRSISTEHVAVEYKVKCAFSPNGQTIHLKLPTTKVQGSCLRQTVDDKIKLKVDELLHLVQRNSNSKHAPIKTMDPSSIDLSTKPVQLLRVKSKKQAKQKPKSNEPWLEIVNSDTVDLLTKPEIMYFKTSKYNKLKFQRIRGLTQTIFIFKKTDTKENVVMRKCYDTVEAFMKLLEDLKCLKNNELFLQPAELWHKRRVENKAVYWEFLIEFYGDVEDGVDSKEEEKENYTKKKYFCSRVLMIHDFLWKNQMNRIWYHYANYLIREKSKEIKCIPHLPIVWVSHSESDFVHDFSEIILKIFTNKCKEDIRRNADELADKLNLDVVKQGLKNDSHFEDIDNDNLFDLACIVTLTQKVNNPVTIRLEETFSFKNGLGGKPLYNMLMEKFQANKESIFIFDGCAWVNENIKKYKEEFKLSFIILEKLSSTFVLGEILGEGGSSYVYPYSEPDSNDTTAMKISKQLLGKQELFAPEIIITRELDHDRIVQHRGLYQYQRKLYIHMERMEESLSDYLKKFPNGLPDEEVKGFSQQILEGIVYLHSCGIVHGDLKTANILLKNGKVKIADFGLAKMIGLDSAPDTHSGVGTEGYKAPEVINNKKYDLKIDIWSFGAIIWELASGKPPVQVKTARKIEDTSLEPNPKHSSEIENIIKICTQPHRKDRLSAEELLQHKFFDLQEQSED